MSTAASADNQPDWSSIRAAAVIIGVREAARRASSHLPAEEQERFVWRVMQRSKREGWIVQANAQTAAPMTVMQGKPLSAPVSSGAEAAAEHLKSLQSKGKLAMASVAVKGLEHIAEQDGEYITATADKAKALAGVYVTAFPEQSVQQAHVISVNLLGLTLEQPVAGKIVELE